MAPGDEANLNGLASDPPVCDPADVAAAAQQWEVYVRKRCLGSRSNLHRVIKKYMLVGIHAY